MQILELTHRLYHVDGEAVESCKGLGFFSGMEAVRNAVVKYQDQPGFCDESKAFVIRRRTVEGKIADDVLYEAMVYVHTPDFQGDFEMNIELGLFGDEAHANRAVEQFVKDNREFLENPEFEVERIVNRWKLDECGGWLYGFEVVRY